MKTSAQAFTKWANWNLPNGTSDDTLMEVAKAAYMAGRRDLLAEQKRRRDHEARQKRLTKGE